MPGDFIFGNNDGVQLIPKLAEKAAELTVYQRTPIWVAP